jgi:phenylalanyl-tRNA synthetase beta chain
MDFAVTAPFELSRSAMISTKQGDFVGIVGELKPSVVKNFKLPEYSASASLDIETLKKIINNPINNYQPLSRYPSTSQDICFELEKDINYSEIINKLEESTNISDVEDCLISTRLIDIYTPQNNSKKRVTFRLKFTSYLRTMTDQEVNKIMDKISVDMQNAVNAQRV